MVMPPQSLREATLTGSDAYINYAPRHIQASVVENARPTQGCRGRTSSRGGCSRGWREVLLVVLWDRHDLLLVNGDDLLLHWDWNRDDLLLVDGDDLLLHWDWNRDELLLLHRNRVLLLVAAGGGGGGSGGGC